MEKYHRHSKTESYYMQPTIQLLLFDFTLKCFLLFFFVKSILVSFHSDKSIGDTSDIISDSSGVGTNSDSAACSIGHPSTTVVCIETYVTNAPAHLSIHAGDVIEVVGSTDCGLLEGYVRGTNRSGFFPAQVVQEVNIRQKNITNVSTANTATTTTANNRSYQAPNQSNRNTVHLLEQEHPINNVQSYSSLTAPRSKKV